MAANEFRRRLDQELRATKARLHDQGWPLDPANVTEATTEAGIAGDPFDRIERTESRERKLDTQERLDDGSYGTCAVCGGEIALKRLHAIPEATTCVRCQENLEVTRDSPPPMRSFKAAASPAPDEGD